MESSPTAWTILAHLLRTQGRKGEILADLHTDFPERFTTRSGLILRRSSGSVEPATVEEYWLPTGRSAGRIVLKLRGIDSIEAAERLTASDLVVATEDRAPLEDADEQYIADLLDCTVTQGGQPLGVIGDVQFPLNANGARLEDATPLLVVREPTGGELLIPFVKEWIVSIDVAAKHLSMLLPEGLLDINSPSKPVSESAR